MSRRVRAVLSATAVACAITAALPGAASADPASTLAAGVERISVAADGTQGDGDSTGASITPDGRSVVFASSATNLTPEGTTDGDRVYVRDRRTALTKQMGAYVPVQAPVISGNGGYVAYPLQWFNDIRIRQYQVATGATASVDCSAHSCGQPSLNGDGRYVAHVIRFKPPLTGQRVELQGWSDRFTVADLPHTAPSRPSVSGDARTVAYQDGQNQDVYVWNRTTGTTTGPLEGAAVAATLVQLSDDGTKVVYLSGPDTYVHDIPTATSRQVPNVRGLAIDPTGRYLLHTPDGTSLVLRDLQSATEETVTTHPATAGPDSVTTGGRDVVFHSLSDALVPGDTNGRSDVFIHHFY
ncbi:hypothetical protein [Streptomyces roseirectus]|nr:hypothetical protein [Streptomyces roseirectus]